MHDPHQVRQRLPWVGPEPRWPRLDRACHPGCRRYLSDAARPHRGPHESEAGGDGHLPLDLPALEQRVDVRQSLEAGERSVFCDLLAAARNPAHAVRYRPTDADAPYSQRRGSATVMNGALISRFIGLGDTAATMAATCSTVSIRGA